MSKVVTEAAEVISSTPIWTLYFQAVYKDSNVVKSVWKKGEENNGGTWEEHVSE